MYNKKLLLVNDEQKLLKNVLFRELWINFDEDSLDKRENNMYYAEENNEASLQSFLHNLMLARETYSFTESEQQAAPLLYRYLRLFCWRPLHALKRDKDSPEKVELFVPGLKRSRRGRSILKQSCLCVEYRR